MWRIFVLLCCLTRCLEALTPIEQEIFELGRFYSDNGYLPSVALDYIDKTVGKKLKPFLSSVQMTFALNIKRFHNSSVLEHEVIFLKLYKTRLQGKVKIYKNSLGRKSKNFH